MKNYQKLVLGLDLDTFGPKLDVWIKDGSRLDRGWIEDWRRPSGGYLPKVKIPRDLYGAPGAAVAPQTPQGIPPLGLRLFFDF